MDPTMDTEVATIVNDVDPITVEVIRNYYIATANQMKSILIRASFNPVIYEMIDFSLGLYDRKAQLLAEGPALPYFCGSLSFAIRNVINGYLTEGNLDDGDVVLSSYGYFTGAHPQDVTLIKPIFIEGNLFGYSACKAHWMDIGAGDIYGVSTTDCWQEGLQIYGAKVKKRGEYDNEIMEILRANTRVPDGVMGDLHGQIAAIEYGAKRVGELIEKYGKDTVELAVARFLDHGEQLARKAIVEMPDGEWSAEGFMDDNGITSDPVPIKLTVKKQGDELIMDTTGSASVQAGPTNCPYASTVSICRLVMKMITTPLNASNEGHFRPLKVIAPEGSIFNPKPPAALFLYGWPAMVLGQLAFKALSQAAPERVVTGTGGDLTFVLFSGVDPVDGTFFASGADEACGGGASIDRDGENALIDMWWGESQNVPVEVIEERYPVRVTKYELRQDSGGPGKFRGGLGVEKHWKALADLNIVSVVERTKDAPFGLFGGGQGKPNIAILHPGTPEEKRIGKVVSYKMAAGEEWHMITGGAGGWGNRYERDPRAVLNDVVKGYVSLESAKLDYGVAIKLVGDELILDEAETLRLRQ